MKIELGGIFINSRSELTFMVRALHKKATIVIYLVLQSTPTYVNAVAGYSIIAPNQQGPLSMTVNKS